MPKEGYRLPDVQAALGKFRLFLDEVHRLRSRIQH